MKINNISVTLGEGSGGIDARLVYGTKTLRWYLVGPKDRDYATGISRARFSLQSEEISRREYLSPTTLTVEAHSKSWTELKRDLLSIIT